MVPMVRNNGGLTVCISKANTDMTVVKMTIFAIIVILIKTIASKLMQLRVQ